MRRPRRWILASILGLLLFGYFLLWLTSPGPGMNRRGFDLVRVGMNEAEVIAILGAEPGDYITGKVQVEYEHFGRHRRFPISIELFHLDGRSAEERRGEKTWYSNEGIIVLRFDADGLVQGMRFWKVLPDTEPFLAKLRRWFLLQA